MIDLNTFNRLKAFETTSWAIWSQSGDNSVDFFRSKCDLLHGSAIFVGLNRSNTWPSHLERDHMPNFHTRGHVGDRRLKRHIQDAGLTNMVGGLMTDVSDVVESKSGNVSVEPVGSINVFVEKLAGLEGISERHIICFGDKAFDTFRRGSGIKKTNISEQNPELKMFKSDINGETWHFYRVWHYSNYGKLLHKSEVQLPLQLAFINERINPPAST